MALSAGRDTPMYAPLTVIRSYPMKDDAIIYTGGMVGLSGGYAVPMTLTTGLLAVGRANATVDNTNGGDGGKSIPVQIGVFRWDNNNSIGQSSVGALAYAFDDQAVTSSSSGASIAGTIEAVDSLGVWVNMGLESAIDNTTLTAQIAAYASTSTPGGASLIGVFDTASLYTAADVEAALAEVMKKANAGLGVPVSFPVILSTATTGQVVYRFKPGVAGKIRTLDASVMQAVSTTGKLATLSVLISGVAVTGANCALNSTNCATLGAAVYGSAATGSNSFTSSQEITVTANTVTTFAEGQVIAALYLQSA
jgi:hypothetical protein